MSIRSFAVTNSLRGLSNEACSQGYARRWEYKGKKYRVETKADMKKRIGRSPDNLDAVAIGIDLCRQRGATPTPNKAAPKRDMGRIQRQAEEEFASGYTSDEYA